MNERKRQRPEPEKRRSRPGEQGEATGLGTPSDTDYDPSTAGPGGHEGPARGPRPGPLSAEERERLRELAERTVRPQRKP